MLIDSHAHLDSPELQSRLPEVMEKARKTGVQVILSIVCTGRDLEWTETFLQWVERTPGVYAAVGVHPHDAHFWTEDLESRIVAWMDRPKVLGWGEIGLDFFYDNSPRHLQDQAFRQQLRKAYQLAKPVIIHSREAATETCEILEEEFGGRQSPGGVMHCFTYDQAVAERCLKIGFYLGFGGIVTFPKAAELQALAARVPEDRYLIETDSPYLAPVPFRGKQNEPAFVRNVAEQIARIRGSEPGQVLEQSSRNFCRLFRIDPRHEGTLRAPSQTH